MITLSAARRERVAAGALLAGAVVFVASALARVPSAGLVAGLTLPAVALAADLVLAAALLTGWYPIRPVAQGLAVFGFLLHVLVALRGGPVWTRGCSALLALVHGWALVLLFLLTASEEDAADADTAGEEGAADHSFDDEPADAGAEWPEPVETPVSELIEVAPARERLAESEERTP